MAYRPHTLIAFGGIIPSQTSTDEIWECTIRGFAGLRGQNTNLPLSNPDTYLAEVAPLLASWFAQSGSRIANVATLEYLKCNAIGADGRYSDGQSHTYDYSNLVSGATSQAVPSFLSLSYTWTTPKARGRAHLGRMYPPNFTYTLSSGAHVSPTDTTNAALAGRAFLQTIANATSATAALDPAVVSGLDGSFAPITGVRVGSVYDVQRRRKNQAVELYSSTPYPPA